MNGIVVRRTRVTFIADVCRPLRAAIGPSAVYIARSRSRNGGVFPHVSTPSGSFGLANSTSSLRLSDPTSLQIGS